MSIKYKFWDKGAAYFVTFAVVEWIDVFTRDEYRTIVVDSLAHCINQKGLSIHAWVLMSNHVHLIISLKENSPNTLSDIMRDLKKYTAMQLIKKIKENERESRKDWMLNLMSNAGKENSQNTNFQFWRHDNHPIEIKDQKHYINTMEYIHNNPVRAGWVMESEHYLWSSASDYAGKTGLLKIEML